MPRAWGFERSFHEMVPGGKFLTDIFQRKMAARVSGCGILRLSKGFETGQGACVSCGRSCCAHSEAPGQLEVLLIIAAPLGIVLPVVQSRRIQREVKQRIGMSSLRYILIGLRRYVLSSAGCLSRQDLRGEKFLRQRMVLSITVFAQDSVKSY